MHSTLAANHEDVHPYVTMYVTADDNMKIHVCRDVVCRHVVSHWRVDAKLLMRLNSAVHHSAMTCLVVMNCVTILVVVVMVMR